MSFCPSCGEAAPTRATDGVEVPCCPEHGPAWLLVRTGLATEVVILREGGVLLTRRAIEPYGGYWAIPGGFINPGESPEEAARREAREEIAVEVEICSFLGLYPTWYVPGDWTVAAVYVATCSSQPRADLREVSEVAWFSFDELPGEMAWDHRHRVLDALAAGGAPPS